MFTGIVEAAGRIALLRRDGVEARLRVEAPFAGSLGRGESVAVDGVCLTVVGRGRGWFEAVASPETQHPCTLGFVGDRKPGDPDYLRRALLEFIELADAPHSHHDHDRRGAALDQGQRDARRQYVNGALHAGRDFRSRLS